MRFRLTRTILGAALAVALGSAAVRGDEAPEAEPAGIDPAVAPAPTQLPFDIPELEEEQPGAVAAPPAAGALSPPVATGAPVHEDIRDIRGPVAIPHAGQWMYTALAAVAGFLILLLAWRWFHRRSHVRARRAYEIAFDQLEEAKALMQPEQARAFSLLVSEAVRTYIDTRYGLKVCRRTTEEVVDGLLSDPDSPLRDHTEPLRNFLGYCDLAKFARWALSVEQMQEMHGSAWRFIEATRPRPEEESTKRNKRKRKGAAPAESMPALATGGAS